MSTNVIQLDDYRSRGNGAREALIDILMSVPVDAYDLDCDQFVDQLLMRLWTNGFKIVPLDENECR